MTDFFNLDRVPSGAKIEIYMQSDWVTFCRNEEGDIVASISNPPTIAYLQRELIISSAYPKAENKYSKMRYKVDGEDCETDLIESVHIGEDDSITVSTKDKSIFFNVLPSKPIMDLEQKGLFKKEMDRKMNQVNKHNVIKILNQEVDFYYVTDEEYEINEMPISERKRIERSIQKGFEKGGLSYHDMILDKVIYGWWKIV